MIFLQLVFGEDERGHAHHVMGIVHNSANYLPDLLEHMADKYPNLTVKNGVLCRGSDIETTTMASYKEQVRMCGFSTYSFIGCPTIT